MKRNSAADQVQQGGPELDDIDLKSGEFFRIRDVVLILNQNGLLRGAVLSTLSSGRVPGSFRKIVSCHPPLPGSTFLLIRGSKVQVLDGAQENLTLTHPTCRCFFVLGGSCKLYANKL